MDIYFSRHAKRQMKWRDIGEDDVREAVSAPEAIEDSIKNRKNALKHIGQKWLKVTFTQEIGRIVIVTVIDKNR
ncbi:MAG: DUF4258 domain-containing protein [Thermodesulfobacteriota bacterium]